MPRNNGRWVLSFLLVTVACSHRPSTINANADNPSLPTSGAAPTLPAPLASDAVARAVVDLLHWGPARVAVSSTVKNSRDYPAHLVDGNSGTAWNSQTRDLVGASIAFEVPADAKIESIVLSAGFDKINAAGEDLFRMNHRIRSVQVFADSTENKPLATFQLDPTRRDPQSFPFAHPGGLYWVKVTAVQPGTKKEGQELAVSEFRVMGYPGSVRYAMPRMPDVIISKEWIQLPLPGLGEPGMPSYQEAIGTIFPSMDALCKHVRSKLAPAWVRASKESGNPIPDDKDICMTKPLKASPPLPASLKSIALVELIPASGCVATYVLETDKGFVIPRNAELNAAYYIVPDCLEGDDMLRVDTQLDQVQVSEGSITLHIKQTKSSTEPAYTSTIDTRWFSLTCALAPEPVTCSRAETESSTSCAVAAPEPATCSPPCIRADYRAVPCECLRRYGAAPCCYEAVPCR